MSDFTDVNEYANHLKGLYAKRNAIFDEMERMFLLVWDEEEKYKRQMGNLKLTKSPDARNQLLGATRLLAFNSVDFSVPHDENADIDDAIAGEIERFSSGVWRAASRVYNNPLESDVALSTLLFAETHIGITKTSDMVARAKGAPPAAIAQLEAIADSTPFVFDVWDPRTGYPDIGPYGLRAFYREVETTIGAVVDEFGSEAEAQLLRGNIKGGRYGTTMLCHLYEFDRRRIWVRGSNDFLLDDNNDLPFIPIVCQLGEGSRIFSEPEYQRQPFLYTLHKSDLWKRQNLMLTVMYTLALTMANPQHVLQTDNLDREFVPDYAVPGGVWKIGRDENLTQLRMNVIDPSLADLQQLAERKGEESTIFGQSLGEPLGGNAPYSMVALLHQAGRLPLAMPQLKSSWAIADAMKKAILWVKHDGKKEKVRVQGKTWELEPASIPDYFELEAKLDVALPQDKLQMANIIKQLRGFVSDRWLMENVLNIGQPDAEMKEAWSEQAANMWFTNFMQMQMQYPPVPPQDVPPGPTQPGGQGGMSPEMMGGGRPLEPMPGEPPADGKMVPPERGGTI